MEEGKKKKTRKEELKIKPFQVPNTSAGREAKEDKSRHFARRRPDSMALKDTIISGDGRTSISGWSNFAHKALLFV